MGRSGELPGGSLREFYLVPPRSRFWRDSLARKHRLEECGALQRATWRLPKRILSCPTPVQVLEGQPRAKASFRGVRGSPGHCSELPGGSLREFYLAPPRSRFWRDSLAQKHRLGECGAAPGELPGGSLREFYSKQFVHKRTKNKRTREEDPGQEDKGEENPYEH